MLQAVVAVLEGVGGLIKAKETAQEIAGTEITIQDLAKKNRTLISFTKKSLVEPFIVSTDAAGRSPVFSKVAKAGLESFVAFFTQAFAILTTVEKISISEAISGLKSAGLESVDIVLRNEDEEIVSASGPVCLPLTSAGLESMATDLYAGLEAEKPMSPTGTLTMTVILKAVENVMVVGERTVTDTSKSYSKKHHVSDPNKSPDVNRDSSSKTNTTKSSEYRDVEMSIPITFSARMFTINSGDLNVLTDTSNKRKSFMYRWNEWRSGGIGFFDLVFAGDLVSDYKNNRIKAKNKDAVNDYITEKNKKTASQLARIGKNKYTNVSMNSVFIATKEDVRVIEGNLGGNLSKHKIAQKFFQSTGAVFLFVLDDDWEKVTIYTEGLKGVSIASYSDFSGKQETDLTELFKSLMSSGRPVF